LKRSLPELQQMKRDGVPIVMITAYDHPTGRIVDEAGVDLVLVGDSAANNVLGLNSTVPATMDQMTMLTAAVSRGVSRAIVVGDLPFMSYQVSDEEAVRNGGRLIKDGGADVVKLEGAGPMLDRVKALVNAGIPVIGHLGLTPQTATSMGGHKAQGRERDTARQLYLAAIALQEAGAFSLVLEAVAPQVAAAITRRLAIPTIGIGSGPHTDGQVLVLHDVLGINDATAHRPRFVKRYAEIGAAMGEAVRAYTDEVRGHRYPAPEHAYTMPDEEVAAFERAIDAGSIEENVLADW
jgi:3-methyl-2-oxobutanoate hydroxymethyltransferase